MGKLDRDWGKGIPEYNESDIMTSDELLNFAMDIVEKYIIEENNYEKVFETSEPGEYPNFIVQVEDGVLWFIIVKAAIAPREPYLIPEVKQLILEHGEKHNAVCFFAPVCFGSQDEERFKASLALRGDGFYTNFKNLEEIVLTEEDIKYLKKQANKASKEAKKKAKAEAAAQSEEEIKH
ncbi:MAG: hypothetical protein IJP23_00445 [Oscillospiraceae bacterium]|nr:hypothetical protein [Oscillospiraceae bacterium]